MARLWTIVARKLAEAGPAKHGLELVCGACGKTEFHVSAGGLDQNPAVYAANLFAQKGWDVGARAADDRCPACAAKARAEKRAKADARKEAPMPSPTAVADPPRQMDLKDRPIILAKLVEVYVGPEVGYDRGWSDKRVAEDLGVPRAWVKELREANFGPARDNEEIRELLAKVEVSVKLAEEIDGRAKAAATDATSLVLEMRTLQRQAAAIRKAVE